MDIDAIKQAFYKSLVKQIGLNNKQPSIERYLMIILFFFVCK